MAEEVEETTTTSVPVSELAAAPEVEESTGDDPDTFDRKYVEDLRSENAKYRTRAKEATAPFDNFDEKDRAYIYDTFSKAGDSDPAIRAIAAESIRNMANIISGDDTPTPAATPTVSTEETKLTTPVEAPVTQADFKKWQAEQKVSNDRATQVSMIEKELTEAGMPRGTAEFTQAWAFARDETAGDLPKAIQMVNDYKQKIVDGALSEKSGQQSRFPSQSNTVSASPGAEASPLTLEDAKQKTLAFLKAQAGDKV